MASPFDSKATTGIGTAATVVSGTVAAGTTHTLTGLRVANIATAQIAVDVTWDDDGTGTNIVYLVKAAPVPVGGALSVTGLDDKHHLKAGGVIKVVSDTAASADVVCSWLVSS